MSAAHIQPFPGPSNVRHLLTILQSNETPDTNPDDPETAVPISGNDPASNLQETTTRTAQPTLTGAPTPTQSSISSYFHKPLCKKDIKIDFSCGSYCQIYLPLQIADSPHFQKLESHTLKDGARSYAKKTPETVILKENPCDLPNS
jgi:hypothetical protein